MMFYMQVGCKRDDIEGVRTASSEALPSSLNREKGRVLRYAELERIVENTKDKTTWLGIGLLSCKPPGSFFRM